MAFLLSPGVLTTEADLTNVVPTVATSIGGFVGVFQWGPVLDFMTIDSQNTLTKLVGQPNDTTFTSFFSAANFLDYADNLKLVRVVGPLAKNAGQTGTAVTINNRTAYDVNYADGQGAVGQYASRYPGSLGNSIQIVACDASTWSTWAYKANFSAAPNVGDASHSDEMHMLIIDALGKFTGVAGTILEKYAFVSKAFDSYKSDGTSNFYKNVLTQSSSYVYWMDYPTSTELLAGATNNWGATKSTVFVSMLTGGTNITLTGGVDDNSDSADSVLEGGWSMFKEAEQVDVNLLFTGPASAAVAKYVIQNVAEARKDCIVFVSPSKIACINNLDPATAVVAWRNDVSFNVNSSYGAMDSGWKYQYDQYNDVYRWIPLNADMAGLHARTDTTNDPWWAAAGLNRGQIKNVVKLSWNPNQTARDTLYQAGINPVTSFPGQGIVLFGNKTLLAKPSAFDRINVRRLFIVLEKAISKAARYSLFEFNDPFTRAQLKAMIEPYLRMVQGRRGIQKFQFICDETNNDSYIVSTNQLVATIRIMPNYTAEFVTLQFQAANNSALFTEQG